jgi:spore germination cell wall hydrolase CwlJ-like protein
MMNKDVEILAKTMYGEARGEYKKLNCGMNSLIAVGNVIINRHKHSGESIETVCLKPKQFSCWNIGDPNRSITAFPSTGDAIYILCCVLAKKLLNQELGDITNGANHYCSKTMNPLPIWAINRTPVFEIGNHVFFKI